jgi:hypothetical protein
VLVFVSMADDSRCRDVSSSREGEFSVATVSDANVSLDGPENS